MTTAHTPGPWIVREIESEITIWSEVVTGRTTETSCTAVINGGLNAGNDEGVMRADARLIAAAPDLLTALEAILPMFDNDSPLLTVYDAEIKQARAAIDKAKGL